jgi:hypothetical protein
MGQRIDAFDEAEHPGQLGELAKFRKRLGTTRGVGPVAGQLVGRRGQQVGLAHTEPAVQVQPDTGQHHPFAQQLSAARRALHGLPAEILTGPDGGSLGRFRRIRAIRREAHLGERWRRS